MQNVMEDLIQKMNRFSNQMKSTERQAAILLNVNKLDV